MSTTEFNKTKECLHSKYFLRKDHVLEISLENDFFYTIKESKEITANIISITNNIPHKVLIIAGNLSLSDDSARIYASTKESTDPILALAIVTNSLPQTIIANFIMKIQKPKIPTKVFSEKESAEKWLRSV
jgi:hypothetical protein